MKGSSSASKYFEIPKIFYISQKGTYSGSVTDRDFNYKAVPICPKEGDKVLRASYWSGKNCLEKSENVTTKEFPFNESGHSEMVKWLEESCLSRDEVKPDYKIRQALAEKIRKENIKPANTAKVIRDGFQESTER